MSTDAPAQQPQETQSTTPQQQQLDKKRVYVKLELTPELLKEAFAAFNVTDARLVPSGRGPPFGFLGFDSEEAAAKAVADMQGKSVTVPLTVELAAAGPKKERKPRTPRQPKAKKTNGGKAKNGEAAATPASPAEGENKEKKEKKPRNRRGKKEKAAANAEAAPAAAGQEVAAAAAPATEQTAAQ